MKKENCIMFNSRFINNYSEGNMKYLPVFLTEEGIKSLNYPEILEEILIKADRLTLNYPEVLEEILKKVDASVFSSKSGSALAALKSYSHSLLDNNSINLKTIATGSAMALLLIYASKGLNNKSQLEIKNSLINSMKYAQLTSNDSSFQEGNFQEIEETIYETIKSAPLPDNLICSAEIPFDADIKKPAYDTPTLASRGSSKPEVKNSTSFSELNKMNASELIKLSKRKFHMTATAYDLSYKSCRKTREHPAYGITASGARATVGRTIAVDPKVVPLGSKVYIIFPESYSHMNGVYVAEDTGSLIKGNKIDIFFGEDNPGEMVVNKKALEFGIQLVEVYLLE
jgi:3D (Asp-Asp-Asp) domain-containing protein